MLKAGLQPIEYILLSERVIKEENGLFSAFCDELGTATFADTLEAASERLSAANTLLLNAAAANGDIEALFKQRGIHMYPAGRLDQSEHFRFEPSEAHFGYRDISHRPYNLAAGLA